MEYQGVIGLAFTIAMSYLSKVNYEKVMLGYKDRFPAGYDLSEVKSYLLTRQITTSAKQRILFSRVQNISSREKASSGAFAYA